MRPLVDKIREAAQLVLGALFCLKSLLREKELDYGKLWPRRIKRKDHIDGRARGCLWRTSDCLSFLCNKVTAFLEELDAMDDQLVSSYYSGNLAEAPHALKYQNYSFT